MMCNRMRRDRYGKGDREVSRSQAKKSDRARLQFPSRDAGMRATAIACPIMRVAVGDRSVTTYAQSLLGLDAKICSALQDVVAYHERIGYNSIGQPMPHERRLPCARGDSDG
jgi:hypothetical protein